MTSKFFFLTTDLDSAEEAIRLALDHGMELDVLFPRDLPVPADAAGLVVELDRLGLDARGRQEWLTQCHSHSNGVPTAVFSYDFDNREPLRLPSGLLASRQLSGTLLEALLQGPETEEAAA